MVVTDPAHKAAADVMRAERLRARLAAPPAAVEVEQRDLSRYDVLLGGGEVATSSPSVPGRARRAGR